MAEAVARKKPGTSFEQAFVGIWSDPTHASLVARAKLEESESSQRVADQRWPIRDAEDEFRRDWSLGSSPGSRRM